MDGRGRNIKVDDIENAQDISCYTQNSKIGYDLTVNTLQL